MELSALCEHLQSLFGLSDPAEALISKFREEFGHPKPYTAAEEYDDRLATLGLCDVIQGDVSGGKGLLGDQAVTIRQHVMTLFARVGQTGMLDSLFSRTPI